MTHPGQPVSWSIGLPPEQFAAAFPFHLGVDRNLRLLQVGSTLQRICPDVQPGADLDRVFRSIRPEGRMTLEWVRLHQLHFFLLEHRTTKLQLRGEFTLLPGEGTLLFLGSPWFNDSSEFAALGLRFEDFAVHDPVVDMLQVLQASKMALADAKKLADKLTRQRTELRDAIQRLSKQEAETRKLALIAARTDNAVVLTDAEGRTVWVNEGFTRITGYGFEEVLGKKPGSILQGPGTDPETVDRIRKRIHKGEGFSEEILNYGKDGQSYWLAIEVQPIRDASGQITNFMAMETDITVRRAALQRLGIQFGVSRVLTESKNLEAAVPLLLKTICENLGWQLGQFWRHEDERLRFVDFWHLPSTPFEAFIFSSRAMEFTRTVGLPGRVWATGEPAWIPDVTRDANFRRNTIAAREGLHGAFAFPIVVRGRLWAVTEFFSRNIEEPDQNMLRTFAAVGNQIAEFVVRRQVEEALQETNTLQQAILEGANYSIISTKPDGIIQTFNSTAERMLGYTSEEVVGKCTPSIIHDPDELTARATDLTRELGREVEPGFEVLVARAKLGIPDEREWTYIHKDGRRFPVRLSVTALLEENAKEVGYLGIASDITESKRAASELLEAKKASEAANQAKSEFLATMSHEIRTPMNGVLGMTELLLRTNLSSRQRAFALAVAQSANGLLHIIDDVLDFSKIEAGRLSIVSEEFDIGSITDEVLEIATPRGLDKNIVLAAIIQNDVPAKLKGDPQRLRQVLINLVGNAVKFTEQGEVSVRIRRLPCAVGELKLRFEIKDTGIGLTREQIQRLFKPFVQADRSSARRFGGTGLGLAISRQLVELMGGRIGVESEAGAGSTFWVELPFEALDASDRQSSHPALASALAIASVRQPTIRESLLELFRAWGVPCLSADTIVELVHEVETATVRHRMPFVVCDDSFLVDGGADLLTNLGRMEEQAYLILLSNRDTATLESDVQLNPFRKFLLIPVKQSTLFETLLEAAENRTRRTSRTQDTTYDLQENLLIEDEEKFSDLRILLVEDHPINRQMCLLMLEIFGIAADSAKNGREAMAAIEEKNYDVILMDCNMPEMDGYETTKSIRQLEATRHAGLERRVQIIALTANVLRDAREQCLAIGMDDYLTKPFSSSELRAVLVRALGRKDACSSPSSETSRLDQLADELDSESMEQMIEDFIRELPDRVGEIERLLSLANREELERTAHSMTGVSASFGLDDLAAQFRTIEEAATAGDLENVEHLLAPLKISTTAAAEVLKTWLKHRKPSVHYHT